MMKNTNAKYLIYIYKTCVSREFIYTMVQEIANTIDGKIISNQKTSRRSFKGVIGQKKNCVFSATVSKNLGRVGIEFFFTFFLSPKFSVKTPKNQ